MSILHHMVWRLNLISEKLSVIIKGDLICNFIDFAIFYIFKFLKFYLQQFEFLG